MSSENRYREESFVEKTLVKELFYVHTLVDSE